MSKKKTKRDYAIEKAKDWRWRLNNLYNIIDKDGNAVKFKENWLQKKVNNCPYRRKIILKYRQGGCTTNEILKMLDFVMFNKNKTACIMADERGNMEKIFNKVRFAHKHMSKYWKLNLAKGGGSKYELEFPDMDSSIYCDLEGRGGTIHWLHISEAAFANPKRIKSTLEAVPKDGIVTFESTPNGMGNHFYKRWIRKPSVYEKMFFPWFLHPEYFSDGSYITNFTKDERELINTVKLKYNIEITKDQIAWRRAKLEDQGDEFLQEYPEDDISCFLNSGDSVFDLVEIKKLIDSRDEPIEDTGTLKIFKAYDKAKHYVCGVDVAEGRGGDYSVATMYEVESKEEVAQLRSNKWKPSVFADKIDELCRKYTTGGRMFPLLGVERNNHGHAVLQVLNEQLHYPNLYEYKLDVPGWLTDKVTRPIMINTFVDGVENGTIIINSRNTLGECLTLVNNDGKIEASEGEHDDTIISNAIALQMVLEAYKSISMYDDISNKILL